MLSTSTSEAPPAESGGKRSVPARTAVGTNWTGAFLLYAKGATLQEVADQLDINFGKLKIRARHEDWEGLVKLNSQLALRAPAPEVSPQSALVMANVTERIRLNREDALKVSHGLRGHILKVLDAYASGGMFLPVADISKLALAARAIDESSMMALGDDPAPKIMPDEGAKKPEEKVVKGAVAHTHFHIHAPAAASAPRIVSGQTLDAPARELVGVPADAINAPRGQRVEMVPEGSDEEDDPSIPTAGGRTSVDFEKLAATAKEALDVAIPAATGIPDFARAN